MTRKRRARRASKAKPARPLSIGIDLGTSRSAVVASNGNYYWEESIIGWPKDFVARKMLGSSVVFGEEALKHSPSLKIVRPLEYGVIREGTEKSEEAVLELLGHLFEKAGADADQPVHAAVGIPAEALKHNRRAIREAVSRYADKLIVVSEPFAVAYSMNALDDGLVIDVGAGTTDFCIMHGTMPDPEDQRSLISAGDSIDRHLLELLQDHYPEADFTLNMARRFKEAHSFVGSRLKSVEVQAPVRGRVQTFNIAREMKAACESIMPLIAETAMELIANFDPEHQEAVRNNIILAGGGSLIDGVDDFLEDLFADFAPVKISRVDEPLYAGAQGALNLAKDMPEEYWEQI